MTTEPAAADSATDRRVRSRFRRGLVPRIAILGFGIVGGWWGLLFFGQRAMLFPAPPASRAPARPPDVEPVALPTAAGPVEAWYLPPTAPATTPAPLLLFTHGNAELIDHWPGAFGEPRRWGFAVLLVEFPGYGRSAGRPSQSSITETILAAFDWAVARPEIDAKRIVPYGRSLGGGAACVVAARRPVPALILESAFTSVRAMASRYAAPGFLVRDPFDNEAVVRDLEIPILVLHGERDRIVPVGHGRALAAASPRATLALLPCGHNDCPRAWPRIRTFLDEHDLLAPPGGARP